MPAAKVTTSLVDQSTRVSSVGTYNAAIVIAAKKGPIETPTLVTSQTDFLRKFTPNERIEIGWDMAHYEAYQYLNSQSNLYVVRAAHTTDLPSITEDDNNVASYGGCRIKKLSSSNSNASCAESFQDPVKYVNTKLDEDDVCLIYGANQGAWNNDVSLYIITDPEQVKIDGAFIIQVYNKEVLVEEKVCSLNPSLKNGFGTSCFIETVLEGSNYIRAKVNTGCETADIQEVKVKATNWTPTEAEPEKVYVGYTYVTGTQGTSVDPGKVYEDLYCSKLLEVDAIQYVEEEGEETPVTLTYEYKLSKAVTEDVFMVPKKQVKISSSNLNMLYLAGGLDGYDVLDSDRIRALKTLNNMNDVNIQLIMDGGNVTTIYQKAIYDVCENREQSCHGILSTSYDDEVNSDALSAIKKYRKYDLNMNNYSMEMYTPHQLYYDEFNDRNIYISPGPYVAASIMRYAAELGWHWAVAGYNRGVVNSLDVAKVFQPSEVDELSDIQVNTIIKDPGYGNVIWDDLTLQAKASDMQDAHISRYLNIYLRPRLKEALKPFLFEFNDSETRQVIIQMIDTFMKPQVASRALYEYLIVCDESNNSDSDVENNILNCWLYVKATKLCKFIRQKVIVTPYSTNLAALGE